MKVNREQASHFKTVVGHYRCSPEEVTEMKAAYERDPEGAAICFAAIAAEVILINGPEQPEHSINGEQFLKIGETARQLQEAGEP